MIQAVKVMHVESGRHLFGGARQVGYLIDGLARRGIENVLVCPSDQPLADRVPAEVVPVAMRGDWDIGLGARVGGVIRDLKPDLVHVHSRRGADSFVGFAARRAGLPAVLTRRVDHGELKFWARYKYSSYVRLVAISRAVQAKLCSSCGVLPYDVEVIESAVDTELFRPDPTARARLIAEHRLPESTIIAIAIGQLITRKGQALLLDIWPSIVRQRPELRLLLYGRGPLERSLTRQIAARGMQRYVKICGHTDEPERVLPGADIVLHPSVAEGLGNVVLEAMSAAVPVIASSAGGLAEVIESDATGVLVPPSHRQAWTDAVLGLAAESERRRSLGSAARRAVEARFTIDTMVDAYCRLYRDEISA